MDTIPGADTLGFGFDILKLYDKSSATSQVFKSGKLDERQITIGTTAYAVPENISTEVVGKNGGDTQVFSTRQRVQDHFSGKAGISGSGFGFKGHFDMSYSKVVNSDKSFYYGLVEMSKHSHTLSITRQGASWLDPDFAEEMKELPGSFTRENRDEFFAFFDKYGTHFVNQVHIGGQLYYYVAIEKSFSSEESVITSHLDMEYKGVFGKVKAEADAEWKKMDKNWAKSRVVSVRAQGGDSSVLDSLEPGFGEWKGESFSRWTQSLDNKPAVMGFNLAPIAKVFTAAKGRVVGTALAEYLKGGLIVTADRDATPGTRQDYTPYPTIIGPEGAINPPTPTPKPDRPNIEVAGIQVVLLDPATYEVIHNRVYYVSPPMPNTVKKMYDDLMTDIRTVRARNYYCAVSIFGLHSAFYPPPEVVAWLTECGAQLSTWKKYIGMTAAGSGTACYTFAGRKGARIGAKEDFTIDPTNRVNKLNSTSLYFIYGSGLRAKGKSS